MTGPSLTTTARGNRRRKAPPASARRPKKKRGGGNPIQIGGSIAGLSEAERQRQVQRMAESNLTAAQKQERHCQARDEQQQQQQQRKRQQRSTQRTDEWYASVLMRAATAQEYYAAANSTSSNNSSSSRATRLWEKLCRECSLKAPLEATTNKPQKQTLVSSLESYCHDRAALVLAEAQHALCEGLSQKLHTTTTYNNNKASVIVHLTPKTNHYSNNNNNNTSKTFSCTLPDDHGTGRFSPAQLFWMRAGTMVVCQPVGVGVGVVVAEAHQDINNNNNNNNAMFLAALTKTTMTSAEQTQQCTIFTTNHSSDGMMLWLESTATTKWRVTPVTSLVSEFRQLETLLQLLSCTTTTTNTTIPALAQALLGYGNPQQQQQQQQRCSCLLETLSRRTTTPDRWKLPTLNDIQAQAALQFLQAPPGSIQLVQGPPGTGKTTFLIATMCQYLRQHRTTTTTTTAKNATLMVAAPTNKAVSVLASRFLAAVQDDDHYSTTTTSPLKMLLAGDAEKLLEGCTAGTTHRNNNNNNNNKHSTLDSIYVYNFLPNLEAELQILQRQFENIGRMPPIRAVMGANASHSNDTPPKVVVSQTLMRLLNQFNAIDKRVFPKQEGKQGMKLQALLLSYRNEKNSDRVQKHLVSLQQLVPMFAKSVASLKAGNSQLFYQINSQLVRTANVIFCTLSAAGSSIFKAHYQSEDHRMTIDALIVDEAAAATEPELLIPFHLEPKKLLAVGDHKQLPATVRSPIAVRRGLDRSLHERLTSRSYRHPCVMLNKQYRMRKEISSFSSNQFYDGKLKNSAQVKSRSYVSPYPLLADRKEPFLFQETDGQEEQRNFSFCNRAEAFAVVEWIHKLKAKVSGRDHQWCLPDKVRIIACYKAQVDLINSLLRRCGYDRLGLVATTVDSSQGCEADLVIVSFVRTCKPNITGKAGHRAARRVAGFLTDDRRLNVALTRAKYELICIGSAGNMMKNQNVDTLRTLALVAQDRGCLQLLGDDTVLCDVQGDIAANVQDDVVLKLEDKAEGGQREDIAVNMHDYDLVAVKQEDIEDIAVDVHKEGVVTAKQEDTEDVAVGVHKDGALTVKLVGAGIEDVAFELPNNDNEVAVKHEDVEEIACDDHEEAASIDVHEDSSFFPLVSPISPESSSSDKENSTKRRSPEQVDENDTQKRQKSPCGN